MAPPPEYPGEPSPSPDATPWPPFCPEDMQQGHQACNRINTLFGSEMDQLVDEAAHLGLQGMTWENVLHTLQLPTNIGLLVEDYLSTNLAEARAVIRDPEPRAALAKFRLRQQERLEVLLELAPPLTEGGLQRLSMMFERWNNGRADGMGHATRQVVELVEKKPTYNTLRLWLNLLTLGTPNPQAKPRKAQNGQPTRPDSPKTTTLQELAAQVKELSQRHTTLFPTTVAEALKDFPPRTHKDGPINDTA